MQLPPKIAEFVARFKQGPSDVVSLDIGSMGIHAVRMRRHGEGVDIIAADTLPPIEPPAEKAEGQPLPTASALNIPARLKARYACLTTTGKTSVIKLLSFPGHFDDAAADKVPDGMGLENPEQYRISYKLVTEGHGKSESRVLAVALPENEALATLSLLPSGLPAPFSLEIAGLATMTTFMRGPAAAFQESSVGAIDFGNEATTFALFNKGVLALVRRFDFGTKALLEKVQESLGVDMETAQGIIMDGAFDISQSVNEVMEPLVKQLIVSRDFVERREDCHITKLYVSGGLMVSRDALDEMKSSMGVEIEFWNPFEGLTVLPDALPANIKGQEWRFASAIGAGLATFEET